MTKVTRFTNDPPQSPYAPIWDYCIAEKKTDIDVEELAKVILLKAVSYTHQTLPTIYSV